MTDASPVPYSEDSLLVEALKTRGPGQAPPLILDVPADPRLTYVSGVTLIPGPSEDNPAGDAGGTIILNLRHAIGRRGGDSNARIAGIKSGFTARRLRMPVGVLMSLTPLGAEALAAALTAWARTDVAVPAHALEEADDT